MAKPNVDLKGRNDGTSTMFVDCPHDGDTGYNTATGIALTSDYSPVDDKGKPITMHGLRLTAGAGNISLIMEGDGKMIVPITVGTADSRDDFAGYKIKTIKSSLETTFNGHIFPLF